jgi:hypothetical protein
LEYEPEDLEFVIDHQLDENMNAGYPPRNLAAWRASCRKDMLTNERIRPGYITRAANGLRARANGHRLTGWREVRGTHGIDYVHDRAGTDRPPWI